MAPVPRRQQGDEMDLGSLQRVITSPWFRSGSRFLIWAGLPVLTAIIGFASAQISGVRDAQMAMSGRLRTVEAAVATVQSTQSERAADSEKFQTQVLAALDDLKSDVVAIKINEASVNTLLREHFPNIGSRLGQPPFVASQAP